MLIVFLLSVLPSIQLLVKALQNITLGENSTLVSVFKEPITWLALGHSLYTAGLGTLIAVLLGSSFAFVLTLTNIRLPALWVFCFMLPMMIPPQITALSWLQLFGPASPILNTLGIAPALGSPQPMYSAFGIALLLGIQHAPLVYLALRAQLICLPNHYIEAARVCGAQSTQVWRDIIIPLAWPGLISGTALAFVAGLGNFGIPAMLGIPAGYVVLPTLVYQKMAGFGSDMLGEVASLSILIALIVFATVLAQQWLSKRASYPLAGPEQQKILFSLGKWRLLTESTLAIILCFILIAPLLALIISSLVPALGMALNTETVTTAAYVEILFRQESTLRAFINSFSLASSSAIVLMLVSLPIAYQISSYSLQWRTLIVSIIEIPFAIPGIVLAVALILLFAKPIPLVNIHIYGSIWIIFLGYLCCFLSVCLKPVSASLSQLDKSFVEAAKIVGAKPLQLLRHILWPLTAPAIFAGGLLVFLISVNELTVSALLWSAGNETLGVMMFNLDESGDSVLASALSVLVVILVATLMALLSLFAAKLPKGVIPWLT
ncbi:MAG: iron ABC transporter permease [Oceanospirillaceae bacterium]|nr:iron ABC transporter permease [Oceanospirillaceae bacterium]